MGSQLLGDASTGKVFIHHSSSLWMTRDAVMKMVAWRLHRARSCSSNVSAGRSHRKHVCLKIASVGSMSQGSAHSFGGSRHNVDRVE